MTVATLQKPAAVPAQSRRSAPATRGKGRQPKLTADQARALTTQIKQQSTQLWLLIAEAHDRKAWAALGYKSWKEYAQKELQMSEQRSFQVLDAAKVMKTIEKAGIDVKEMAPPPARVVQVVKSHLPKVEAAARQSVREGGTALGEALRAIAKEHTVRVEAGSKPLPPRPSGKVECPGCKGTGLLSKTAAKKLEGLLADG